MKYTFSSFIICILSFSCVIGMDEPNDKPHSIVFLKNNQVAVASNLQCRIFDQKSQEKLTHVLPKTSFFDLCATLDGTKIALSERSRSLVVFDPQTETTQRVNENYINEHRYIAIKHNKLFSCARQSLYSYDTITGEEEVFSMEIENATVPFSPHPDPLKNEFILGNNAHHLCIIQPHCTPFIKTHLLVNKLTCQSADYAPDGNTIIICDSTSSRFLCDLNSSKNPLPAYQLMADDKKYVANAWHPKYKMIALLTKDNIVHWFNHEQQLIAKTQQLEKQEICDLHPHKRLSCDKQGKYLAAALNSTWTVIDIPQNNFYEIWKFLRYILPKEIAISIMANIFANINAASKQKYTYFNLNALLNTTPIQQATPEKTTVATPAELETETKNIKAIYISQICNATNFYVNI